MPKLSSEQVVEKTCLGEIVVEGHGDKESSITLTEVRAGTQGNQLTSVSLSSPHLYNGTVLALTRRGCCEHYKVGWPLVLIHSD